MAPEYNSDFSNGRRKLNNFPIDLMRTSPQGIVILHRFFGGYENANSLWVENADRAVKTAFEQSLQTGNFIAPPLFSDDDVEESGANAIQGSVFSIPDDGDDGEGGGATTVPISNPYYSIVQGWNQKLVAGNVDLSSLVPFVELYAVFASDDLVYNEATNRFTGIKNRLIPVRFTRPPNSLGNGSPSLPPNVTQESKLARIGSYEGQLNKDYTTYSNEAVSGGDYPVDDNIRSFRGQPGINDLAISRGSRGAFNIKYDLGITLPNPEIINDQYEYSKLLLPNSIFLIVHGWKVSGTSFFAESYPPLLTAGNNEFTDVVIGGTNNGFWGANLTTLYNFNFEFDNVGHLVGKLSFISAQSALLASLETSMVGGTMIKNLKDTDPNILARAVGKNDEEKQNVIFSSGVPWTSEDRSGTAIDEQQRNTAAIEESVVNVFRQISNIQGNANIESEIFSLQQLLNTLGGDFEEGRIKLVADTIRNIVDDFNNDFQSLRQDIPDDSDEPPSNIDFIQELGLEAFQSFFDPEAEPNENLLYNYYLLSRAIDNRDLIAYIPPTGFIVDGIQIKTRDTNLTASQQQERLRAISRGYLTDSNFTTVAPSLSSVQPTSSPLAMPSFGANLQRIIFDSFDEDSNLNNGNYSRLAINSVASEINDELKSIITNTSVLSLPVVRSQTRTQLLPDLSEDFEENFQNSVFMIEHTALGGSSTIDEPKDIKPWRITFPRNDTTGTGGIFITGDNEFIFANEGNAPAELETAVPIVIDPTAAERRNANGSANDNARYVYAQTLILDSGFSISRTKLLKNQPYDKPSAPIPLLDENNAFFVPGFDNFLRGLDIGLKNKLEGLKEDTFAYVQSQDAFRRTQIGFSGNNEFDLDGVVYSTYMRPAYFFLGSVLESLRIATNSVIKFYYKPFKSRVDTKPFTIQIPDQSGGDSTAVAIIDNQIRAVEQNMVNNGFPEGIREFPLSEYGYEEPTEGDLAEVQLQFRDLWRDWNEGLSEFIVNALRDQASLYLQTMADSQGVEAALVSIGIKRQGNVPSETYKTTDDFVDLLLTRDDGAFRERYSQDTTGREEYKFVVREIEDLGNGFIMPAGVYSIVPGNIAYAGPDSTDEDDDRAILNQNFVGQYRTAAQGVPSYNSLSVVVQGINTDYATGIDGGRPQKERDQERLSLLLQQKSELSVIARLQNIEVKSAFEIPLNIQTVEHILMSEGNAPTHNMLKKVIDAVQETMPNLRISMRTSNIDPSYIEIFASAVNEDGIIQEIMDEIDVNRLNVEGSDRQTDLLRSTVIRDGTRVLSNNVAVFNFGTADSLVESFSMSSKIDPMAFTTQMTPAILGGAVMNVTNILREGLVGNRDRDNILSDIRGILEDDVIGLEDFKTLQIVDDDGKVTDAGMNKLRTILAGEDNQPILQKTAMTLIEDLATANVSLRNKLMALQSEYFNGLNYADDLSVDGDGYVGDTKAIPNSKYAGSLLGTFLRSITVTIHGTAGFNVHDYVYIKGTMSGVEGIYIISNVNESLAIGSFTTTLECKLIEYTSNNVQTNPLAYKGEASIRALAEQQRKIAEEGGDVNFTDVVTALENANSSQR